MVTLDHLCEDLNHQIGTRPIGYLYLGDNKRRSVGEKRNALLSISRAQWVCFLDDDDSWHDGAVNKLWELIKANPEKKVIAFRGTENHDGAKNLDFRYDRNYSVNHRIKLDGKSMRGKIPDHLCAWKRELALKESFPEINLSEDHRWAEAMKKHYSDADQLITDDYIYHYEFNRSTSLCREG
jgi:glycosyltransferase involved in cell wall biosynthesis